MSFDQKLFDPGVIDKDCPETLAVVFSFSEKQQVLVFLLPNLSSYGDSFSIIDVLGAKLVPGVRGACITIFDVLGAELVPGVSGACISVVGVRSSKHRALDRHQGGGRLLHNTRETG